MTTVVDFTKSPPGAKVVKTNGGPANDAERAPPWVHRLAPAPAEWFTRPPPRRTWLLRDGRTSKADGVLPLGKCGELIGEGGVSKTMALVQLAIAVSTGVPWLGTFSVESAGKVLLILGEEDQEEVHRRLYNAARAMRAPIPAPGMLVTLPLAGVPCSLVESDADGNPSDTSFLLWLRAYVEANPGWKLFVLDPLSRFAGLDAEKDNAAATRFVQGVESIATAAGASGLVAHHTNQVSRGAGGKVTGVSSRGSTAIVDGFRWGCALASDHVDLEDEEERARLGELVTLSFFKSNYSRKGEPLVLRRDLDHGGALVPLDDTDKELVALSKAAASPKVQKTAEREEKTKRDAEARARKQAVEEAQRTKRREDEDRALVAILRTEGGLTGDEIRARMAAQLDGCSHGATDVAIARLGKAVRKEKGQHNARLHFLAESELPTALREEAAS